MFPVHLNREMIFRNHVSQRMTAKIISPPRIGLEKILTMCRMYLLSHEFGSAQAIPCLSCHVEFALTRAARHLILDSRFTTSHKETRKMIEIP